MRRVLIGLTLAALFAAAGCAQGAETVQVSGTETCVSFETIADLHEVYECEDETSDPRVSGSAEVEIFLEHEAPSPMWGTMVLTNTGGTWRGDWTGEVTADGNHVVEGVLIGEGDYDGLRYIARWEGYSYPWDVTGTIEPVS